MASLKDLVRGGETLRPSGKVQELSAPGAMKVSGGRCRQAHLVKPAPTFAENWGSADDTDEHH